MLKFEIICAPKEQKDLENTLKDLGVEYRVRTSFVDAGHFLVDIKSATLMMSESAFSMPFGMQIRGLVRSHGIVPTQFVNADQLKSMIEALTKPKKEEPKKEPKV